MVFNYRRVNVIGAGRLGKVMAYLFSKYLGMEIVGICNQSLVTSEMAVLELGQGHAIASIASLEPADIYLITVPDDKIEHVALTLKKNHLPKHTIVMHFSANLGSEVLWALDCRLASVHPMFSFSDFKLSIANFKGTYCAIETKEEGLLLELMDMFQQLGAKPFAINANSKVLYHTAAVIAANYTVALAHASKKCLIAAGIDDDLAMPLILSIMQSVLNNLKIKKDCKQALTGPIARADLKTIEAHLQALEPYPQLRQVYQVLGCMSLDLVNHSDECMQKLNLMLDGRE